MKRLTLHIGNKNYSSWSFRPWIAMAVSGIEFEERLIPFDFEGGNPAIKDLSPSGKVPVLEHGDVVVWESLAILEYLAELFPKKGLWPEDRAARARARAVSSEMATGFFALRNACPFNMRRPPKPVVNSDGLVADVKRIDRIWSECLKTSGGPFLFGRFSAADAMYAPIVNRFDVFCLTPSAISRSYMDRMTKLPAWGTWRAAALAEPWIVEEDEVD